MGNAHSSGQRARPDHARRHSLVSKRNTMIFKRSSIISTLTRGDAFHGVPEYQEPLPTITEHKRNEQISLDAPPLYAFLTVDVFEDSASAAYKLFLKQYPHYQLTWTLDALRRDEFARLDRSGETYVDYMGGSLYPESLIRVQTDFLHRNILGNTHSVSNSSRLSATCATEARKAVLSFFRAPPGYTVVFTANATGALKLVGESFPFKQGSAYVLGTDSHNSVHGIRKFAAQRGAQVHYIDSTEHGGLEIANAKTILERHRPQDKRSSPSLFALTGQSNISNSKNPLSLIGYASSQGYFTLLDAAALAPTSPFSLEDTPVDAMAVSFYKMFGYPTGVGALIAKEEFLAQLERPWFAGGTVDVVQAPGLNVTMSEIMHERFEDGTINYLSLPAVTEGLRFLSAYLPFLPLRLSSLTSYLASVLSQLRHDSTGTQVVRVLSRAPSRLVTAIGEQADTGSTVSVIFLFPSGETIPISFIEYAASRQNISLRTGCMCNPGGAASILGLSDYMEEVVAGSSRFTLEQRVGYELGVVRISLGLASNFHDVHRVIKFASMFVGAGPSGTVWQDWLDSKRNV